MLQNWQVNSKLKTVNLCYSPLGNASTITRRKRHEREGKQAFACMPLASVIRVCSWVNPKCRQLDNGLPNNLPKASRPYQQCYNHNLINMLADSSADRVYLIGAGFLFCSAPWGRGLYIVLWHTYKSGQTDRTLGLNAQLER